MVKKIIKYFIDVCILNKRLGICAQKKFLSFGEGSYIATPLLISHPEKISLGRNVSISKNIRMELYKDDTGNFPKIIIGDGCDIVYNVTILAAANVTIGKNVLIASNVLITSESHGINPELPEKYIDQELIATSITINDNVWIGEKSIILPGVTIGKGSVVGAGSVVTKNVPAYSIAVGNPAKVIKVYDFAQHEWKRTTQ